MPSGEGVNRKPGRGHTSLATQGGKDMADANAAKVDPTRDNQENELQAEQESADAMDAEVSHGDTPEPPGASQTTEGQPS